MTNPFVPIATNGPPNGIPTRGDHPVPRLGIADQPYPKETNKFYANFFLGSQTQSTWTHPYSVSWSRGVGNAQAWGMSVSHIDRSMVAFGPSADNVTYFINPIGIQSIIFGAAELGPSSTLTTDGLQAFSVNVHLNPSAGAAPAITFPLVQGMGFVTGIYNNSTPWIQSSIFFRSLSGKINLANGIVKYQIVLEDGSTWLLYASTDLNLTQQSNTKLAAVGPWSGTIQVAKIPPGVAAAEGIYDSCAGTYAVSNSIYGTVSSTAAAYVFNFQTQGSNPLLMFALPHHVASFAQATSANITPIQLYTTTKGLATAVRGNVWELAEPELPSAIGFQPWTGNASITAFSQDQLNIMAQAAANEIAQDVSAASNLDSMYFSGKQLSKYALVVYVVHDILQNTALAQTGLDKLKAAFARFTSNTQKFPLTYETAWGGLVSTASYVTGDPGVDFGGSYYNDHHFHYGYFIHAAAIIGYLDPTWLPANVDWVNFLCRDAGNGSIEDNYFPFSRSFDWFHGHSWAKGLFESADGKDQESTSEDCLFAYGLKMWGRTSGNAALEARGNLMLAVLRRSLQNYFLMQNNNTVQPPQFIHNKVTGILFENKIDHATYFGNNIEYIEGIHMIPQLPFATYTRHKEFVQEEWDTYFSNGRVDAVAGGWRGILYANLAAIDAQSSYNFFANANFDYGLIDGGQSRTWALANGAALLTTGANGSVQSDVAVVNRVEQNKMVQGLSQQHAQQKPLQVNQATTAAAAPPPIPYQSKPGQGSTPASQKSGNEQLRTRDKIVSSLKDRLRKLKADLK